MRISDWSSDVCSSDLFPAQRDQVIVVNPEQVVRLDQRDQRVGETGVHPFIAPGKAALELRKIDTIVEQGPQRAVGIAVVIFVYVLLFEIDGGGSDAVIGLEIDLAGEMRGRVARPSEPEAAVLPQRGGQCDGQPARSESAHVG